MHAIVLKNITKYFNVPEKSYLFGLWKKWRKKGILKDISFKVKKGSFSALLGPNGSGKTTTIKILSGILTPEKGVAKVCGFIPWERKKEFFKKIGTLFGNRTNLIYDIDLIESFLLFKEIYELSDSFFEKQMSFFESLLELDKILHTPVRKLSFGQRMKAELAITFLHKPEVVFLDEPTIGLDILAKEKVHEFLTEIVRKMKTTVLLTTHNIHDVEVLCNDVFVMKDGSLIWQGKKEELMEEFTKSKSFLVSFSKIKNEKALKELEKEVIIHEKGRDHLKGKITKEKEKRFLELLFSALEIDSLNVENQKLEEVIKELFKGSKNEKIS